MWLVEADPVYESGDDIPGLPNVFSDDDSAVAQLEYRPSVGVANTVYIGSDNGLACGTAVEKVTEAYETDIVYCFNVSNFGNTYLGSVTVNNAVVGFSEAVNKVFAPGDSLMISVPSTIMGNYTNNVVVVATPVLLNGDVISGAAPVMANDDSEVGMTPKPGAPKSGDKPPYSPPTPPGGCIQNKWDDAGKSGELICATKDVFLEKLASPNDMSCTLGDSLTITVEGSILIQNGGKFDLGWYVASDGGDALLGTCIVNGIQNGNPYDVQPSGKVAWDTDGADGDQCGDVFVTSNDNAASIDIPFVVSATLPCKDDNDDGNLDFAVCFTWRDAGNNDVCTFTNNIPGDRKSVV